MKSIQKHNGKNICNECWAKLPKEETRGLGMRAIGWVPDSAKYGSCHSCGGLGMVDEDHLNLIKVDPCPDANGYATIRWDDGSGNGDTERQPIATVYDWDDAQAIVDAWNACQYRSQLQ